MSTHCLRLIIMCVLQKSGIQGPQKFPQYALDNSLNYTAFLNVCIHLNKLICEYLIAFCSPGTFWGGQRYWQGCKSLKRIKEPLYRYVKDVQRIKGEDRSGLDERQLHASHLGALIPSSIFMVVKIHICFSLSAFYWAIISGKAQNTITWVIAFLEVVLS